MTDIITENTLSEVEETSMIKAVTAYLKQALHSPPSNLYVIRKEWKYLTKERDLLIELFKEAKSGNLDKTALFAKDPFKSVRDEMIGSIHEVVPRLNQDFDYILATIINAGLVCSNNFQQAELLKCHMSLNYFSHKLRSVFNNTDFDLLQLDLTSKNFFYLGNIIILDLTFISVIQFLLNQIRKAGNGKILITDEDWIIEKIIEFQCTASSSEEVIRNIFEDVIEDGIDLGFCKKTMQLYGGDITAALNNTGNIIFTLTLPAKRD
ncbi:MAG: hypothetical protein K0R49_1641 [Burkholderiales bacterium]|jgi:hypothetical protein|nr:hypothetical protein [Burkholderiales bacterium]